MDVFSGGREPFRFKWLEEDDCSALGGLGSSVWSWEDSCSVSGGLGKRTVLFYMVWGFGMRSVPHQVAFWLGKGTVLLLGKGKCCDLGSLEKRTVLLLGKCCDSGSFEKRTVPILGKRKCCALGSLEKNCSPFREVL